MIDFFLADDLSGALDAAGAFHTSGRRVRIVLSADAWDAEPGDDLVGVTTETRNLPPACAAEIVTRAILHGQSRGARLVYKKIDSTMRGPVAAELQAVAAALPNARILFTPANPAVGRTVQGGVLCVHGVPVADTAFARDPASPVRHSEVAVLLGNTVNERIVIVDAATDADLERAVDNMASNPAPWIAVGAGALARPVAARLAGATPARRREFVDITSEPILMVGGSAHPANRTQARTVAEKRGFVVHEVSIAQPEPAAAATRASLRERGAAALVLEDRRGESANALRAITRAAVDVIRGERVSRVFVTGGETAFALCREMRIATLSYLAEIEPGLSLSRGRAADGEIVLAIKPGGFGDELTWDRAWRALRGDSRR